MFQDLLKTLPQYLLPKRLLTTLAGFFAQVQNPTIKNYLITQFIAAYQVAMHEALVEDPKAYSSFNDFFIRHLKPEVRTIAEASVISPVDGCISELGNIEQGQLLQAKGHHYSVQELLACSASDAELFKQGKFATLYLAPKDYHRVHMPIDGTLKYMHYVPGALFSVQPCTARTVPKLFARNERLVLYFDTKMGPMVMVMVGAVIVGGIATTWHGSLIRSKKAVRFDYQPEHSKTFWAQGEEIGYFQLGSTVVLLFAEGQSFNWQPALKAGTNLRFGEALGQIDHSKG